ncbi:MAG: PQQ-binding-like beta-propeller repeat protein [Candidatus Zixiibacteriota bacterium]|nr:MAG: PQQ-binding-like beta-propeller repeat protein [candidate division Zixibacteria bacterium]
MKTKYSLVIILIALCALPHCTRKFRLKRGEEVPPSDWVFARRNPQATGMIQSEFGGMLNVRWEDKISDAPIGPMTIGAGKLILPGSRGRVYFFDLATGKYRGRYKARSGIQTGLAVIDSLAYFGVGPPKNLLVCLNLHNRRVLWKADLKDVSGPPIIVDNRLYAASSSKEIYCFDRLNGNVLWSDSAGAISGAGPSYGSGTVYFPFDDGSLRGYDAMTGKLIFSSMLDQALLSKAAIDDHVYAAGIDGGFFALARGTGEPVWTRRFDWPIWTAPAVGERLVYVGDSHGFLWALDKADGTIVWEFATDGVILASPIVVGEMVVFASLDRGLYCLEKNTGQLISRRSYDHEIRFPAVSSGGAIFVALQDGSIQCLGE